MFYENELRFMTNTLKKNKVRVSFIRNDDLMGKFYDETFKILFDEVENYNESFSTVFEKIDSCTIYFLKDSLKLSYLFFKLPATQKNMLMVIGPYLSETLSQGEIIEISEKYNMPSQKQKHLHEYYISLPVIPEYSPLFVMIDTFAELIWGGGNNYKVVDINSELSFSHSAIVNNDSGKDTQDILAKMEIMEKRYAFEKELMRAVSLGQEKKIANIKNKITDISFENRLSDPVRNIKNYCIITNTLLRKAAEDGMVHPFYLNDISSGYALKIEQVQSVKEAQNLMDDMFYTYCRAVRKHSTKKYSMPVQRAIALINADLSENLTLSSLAKPQNLSTGYLSSLFKKETGKTITEYILDERMKLAMNLLSTTSLQIQAVALHCGIMDVQYFSKLFKKHTGKTPKEYRKSYK